MSIQTVEKVILSRTQADMNPNDEIIFDVNPDECALMNNTSYVQFTALLSGDFKASLDGAAAGHSVIDRYQVWTKNGETLLENIEEAQVYIGTKFYNDRTEGTENLRQLLEGKNSDWLCSDSENGGVQPIQSQYFSNAINAPLNATPQFQKVQCCLPLYQSGVFNGDHAFPVLATEGIQLRIYLAPAMKAITACRADGMVVQRDRSNNTGQALLLASLPYVPATHSTPAGEPGTSNFLPQTFQLAVAVMPTAFAPAPDASLPDITSNPTLTTGATVSLAPSSTSGAGVGLVMSLTALVGAVITGMTVAAPGSGYAIGDTVTWSQADLAASAFTGSTGDLVLTLTVASLTVQNTTELVLEGVGGTVGASTGVLADPLKDNVTCEATGAGFNCMMCVGQSIYYLTDAGQLEFAGAVSSITAVGTTTVVQIDTPFAGVLATVAANPPCFTVVGDNPPSSLGNGIDICSYTLSEVQLVVGCVQAPQSYYAGMMSKVKSQGNFQFDIKTFNLYRSNLQANELVSQSLLPLTENRCKAVLQHTVYPLLSWNRSAFQPLSDEQNSYQYQLRNVNTPDRKVSTDLEFDTAQNKWNNLADHEKVKCLAASKVTPRFQVHPAGWFQVGRELAKRGHSYNASDTGDVRLTQNYGNTRDVGGVVNKNVVPQYNKIMYSLVNHFRRIAVAPNNVTVTY